MFYTSYRYPYNMKLIDLTGKRFGRLTVIERSSEKNQCSSKWICECDCGNVVSVYSHNLRQGTTVSCGCYNLERLHNDKRHLTHGLGNHPIYETWCHMKTRCCNPNATGYENWGGRGITICDEWKEDFVQFYDWSITHGWREGLTIDRIDNDGPYSPDNCRWVTPKEQANNTRRNHILEFNGKRHTISEWSEITGIDRNVICKRITTLGWTEEKALTTPVRRFNK